MGKLLIKRLDKTITKGEICFDCGNTSINNLIGESYLPTLYKHAYAYEITYNHKVVGYYMLKFLNHTLEDAPERISDYRDSIIDDFFSVHVKYIAVDKKFQKHKIGTDILKAIIKQVKQLSDRWPVRMISLEALYDKINWYQELGFEFYNDNDCKYTEKTKTTTELMYIDVINNPAQLLENI